MVELHGLLNAWLLKAFPISALNVNIFCALSGSLLKVDVSWQLQVACRETDSILFTMSIIKRLFLYLVNIAD